jgi:hypothetical protein
MLPSGMSADIPKCEDGINAFAEVRQHVEAIQVSMVDSATGCFLESELDHLRVVIRLSVEFHYYVQRSCAHVFCLEYVSESIFSGIDSFMFVFGGYQVLVGATGSEIDWDEVSATSLKQQFARMFDEFARETVFERKCRLLLDLFKLQIVFAGVSYGQETRRSAGSSKR